MELLGKQLKHANFGSKKNFASMYGFSQYAFLMSFLKSLMQGSRKILG